ncbi:MAG: FHA domain-containing protein [Planctomycetes bacterium]|nr:FHA domain-containing protein [Planctomycetota bacterium]
MEGRTWSRHEDLAVNIDDSAILMPGALPPLPRAAPVVKLTVVGGSGEGQKIEIHRPVAVLGDRRGCKVRLKHPEVSGIHCAIVNTGHRVFLRDLLSKHGTFLNDMKAEHELLDDGDVVRIGTWEFRVTIATASSEGLSDYTGVNFEPAPSAVGVQREDNGKLIKLPREVNLIGRKTGCDILLPDQHVSRAHALMFEYLGQPAIVDLFSENGCRINNARVGFAPLETGDVIEIEPFTLVVRIALPNPQVADNGQKAKTSPTRSGIAIAHHRDHITLDSLEVEHPSG